MLRKTYLKQLIETYYKHYLDKELVLSVYNHMHEQEFTTIHHQNFWSSYGFPRTRLQKTPAMTPSIPYGDIVDKLFTLIEETGRPYNLLIFTQVKSSHGGGRWVISPIYAHDLICGFEIRFSLITSEFIKNNILEQCNKPIKNKIPLAELQKLSKRTKQVLFLTILGYSQQQIAEILTVTRGTIATVIHRLAVKFNLESSKLHHFLERVNAQEFIQHIDVTITHGIDVIKIIDDYGCNITL